VRGCSHPHGPHAGAGERRERKKCKIRLTHGEAGHTMPRTHHNTAAFERGTPSCRRRPLRHAGLATLALRKLNRQSTGVPAALASRTARRVGVSCRMTAVSETGSLALHSEAANYPAGMCPAWSIAKLPGRRRTASMKPATHRLEGGFCRTVACTRVWPAVSHCMADSRFLEFAPTMARGGSPLFLLMRLAHGAKPL
jgi:hypothetical protein